MQPTAGRGCTRPPQRTRRSSRRFRRAPLSQRPKLGSGAWREFGRRLSEVAAATAAEGVQLAYHHHMGTVVESEADIAALPHYAGWVILEAEQDPKIAAPFTYASLGFRNLQQLLAGRLRQ